MQRDNIIHSIVLTQAGGVIDQGADRNTTDKMGRSLLINAVIDRQHEFVTRLLARNVNPDLPDHRGWTALHFAAQNYDDVAVQLLLHAGAKVDVPNSDGNTPLGIATFASRGRGEVIRLLLAAGASPDHENTHGQSPRGLAEIIANYDVARFFSPE